MQCLSENKDFSAEQIEGHGHCHAHGVAHREPPAYFRDTLLGSVGGLYTGRTYPQPEDEEE